MSVYAHDPPSDAELSQMLCAPSDAYSAAGWCYAANLLMERLAEERRVRRLLAETGRAFVGLPSDGSWTTAEYRIDESFRAALAESGALDQETHEA